MKKLLIANRGEIARRVLKAARERGYLVAVISTAEDRDSLVCEEVDAVLEVSSFLNAEDIVKVALEWGTDLIHPGYGFLSENADFAQRVESAGLTFVGPRAANILDMGSKESAKRFAQKCGVPVLNALFSAEIEGLNDSQLKKQLDERNIRSPYLVKASAGGGGRGMRVVEQFSELANAIKRASDEAKNSFKDGTVFIENYLVEPRHIEIQLFGDGEGGGVFFGERECSLQRRHQKVIEEAPSHVVSPELRERMGRASLALVKETKYRGAGTAEFLLDKNFNFYFLEMNTRLQVEHPVTEIVFGVDLVHAQFDLAEGRWPTQFGNPNEFHLPVPVGVALEARVLAEDPRQNYLPTPGKLLCYVEPGGANVRVDSGVSRGRRVNSNFDSMIAKLICSGDDRASAIACMQEALQDFVILGTTTNLPFIGAVISHPDFRISNVSTAWLGQHQEELNRVALPTAMKDFVNSEMFTENLLRCLRAPANKVHTLSSVFGAVSSRYFNGDASPVHIELVDENCLLVSGRAVCDLAKKIPGSELSSLALREFSAHARGLGEHAEFMIWVCATGLNQYAVQLFGEVLNLDVSPKIGAASSSEKAFEMRAPMAGKVLEINVRPGATIEEGQVAFVLESMKMQLEVKAKARAKVDKILVEVGQVLTGPDNMAQLSKVEND